MKSLISESISLYFKHRFKLVLQNDSFFLSQLKALLRRYYKAMTRTSTSRKTGDHVETRTHNLPIRKSLYQKLNASPFLQSKTSLSLLQNLGQTVFSTEEALIFRIGAVFEEVFLQKTFKVKVSLKLIFLSAADR